MVIPYSIFTRVVGMSVRVEQVLTDVSRIQNEGTKKSSLSIKESVWEKKQQSHHWTKKYTKSRNEFFYLKKKLYW